jgi:hypothetical protein
MELLPEEQQLQNTLNQFHETWKPILEKNPQKETL